MVIKKKYIKMVFDESPSSDDYLYKVKVSNGNQWTTTNFFDLKMRDIFKIFTHSGSLIKDPKGHCVFKANRDAHSYDGYGATVVHYTPYQKILSSKMV